MVAVTGTATVGGTAYPCSAQVTLPAGLPPGVTLRQIDGGPSYYADHGFTFAHDAGWDDPSFFPVGCDYAFYPANSTAVFKDLGLNFSHRVTGDTNLSVLRNAGIWALPSPGEGTSPGAETIGWHIEEPQSWADIASQVTGLGGLLTGRLLQIACTWNQFAYGGYAGTPGDGSMRAVMSSPVTAGRHLDVAGDDMYWFAASGAGNWGLPYAGAVIYGTGANPSTGAGLTAGQCARGCRYGDMTDWMRAWTGGLAPAAPYIETEDGLAGTGARRITPPELNWAVWSAIIHGARWILYFGTTSNFGSGSTFGFSRAILPGQSISVYDQARATNGLVRQMAPVLNSPFADGYFTVTPPPVVLSAAAPDSGIDAMAKYCAGPGAPALGTGSGFYIFASTRESGTRGGISAVFTTAGGYAGPVTVVNENRMVTAVSGVFSDTFAHASTVHIYYIPHA